MPSLMRLALARVLQHTDATHVVGHVEVSMWSEGDIVGHTGNGIVEDSIEEMSGFHRILRIRDVDPPQAVRIPRHPVEFAVFGRAEMGGGGGITRILPPISTTISLRRVPEVGDHL